MQRHGDSPQALALEYAVFARYLGTRVLAPHAAELYARMHAQVPRSSDTRFDHWLVQAARQGPRWAGLADAYARRVQPYGLLRRKLTLTLALLENGRDTHARYDTGRPSPLVVAVIAIGMSGVFSVVRTLVGIALFAPMNLVALVHRGSDADG